MKQQSPPSGENQYDSLSEFVNNNREWVDRTITAQNQAKSLGDYRLLDEVLAEIEDNDGI